MPAKRPQDYRPFHFWKIKGLSVPPSCMGTEPKEGWGCEAPAQSVVWALTGAGYRVAARLCVGCLERYIALRFVGNANVVNRVRVMPILSTVPVHAKLGPRRAWRRKRVARPAETAA